MNPNYAPVKCYTCGKSLASLQIPYEEGLARGQTINETLDQLGIANRYCCRSRMISQGQIPMCSTVLLPKDETVEPPKQEPRTISTGYSRSNRQSKR